MSFVIDQIRRIDAQLDRLQLVGVQSTPPTLSSESTRAEERRVTPGPSSRSLALQAAIRGLSPGSTDSRAILRPWQVQNLLSVLSARSVVGAAVAAEEEEQGGSKDRYEEELEWLLVSKATTQVYGHVLNSILDETVALADDIYYWDAVLTSRRYTVLYGIQISPGRFWDWTKVIWSDVRARGGSFSITAARQDATDSLGQRWAQFYGLVRQVVSERSVSEVQKQALSPVTRLRGEMRQKQTSLKKIRLRNANALGVLLGEGLANDSVHGEGLVASNAADTQDKFKNSVARNVALMEAVLAKVNDLKTPINQFDAAIGELTGDDPFYADVYETAGSQSSVQPEAVAQRLTRVLALGLPQYADTTKAIVQEHGKPSRIVRYWLPVTVGILSSSTVLRMLVNRKAEILQWIQDFGSTIFDFWSNWVVEPMRKVIKTIRHDEGSEVSIMSKRSLEGDRESLERMVVDFAIDNPVNTSGSSARLTEAQIGDLRLKVREGDLTPVLKAYEKDLTSPFMGTIRGNLIRALLIQIQKTKVDVEVAIGGIDALLKSQELVFGFVGLTPGILVTYSAIRYVQSSLSEKRGSKAARKQGKMLRQLRNIDRILTNSTPTDDGELFYKDQGLLLCEVHVLRQAVEKTMPQDIYREFGEDAEELCDVRTGVDKQRKAAERIRWAYGRYLS